MGKIQKISNIDAQNLELPEEIKIILNQPFHYLAKGAQCYVFLSEDKKYVLKFFRNDWTATFPFLAAIPHFKKRLDYREIKLQKDLKSYELAEREFSLEAGLLFLHLKATKGENPTCTLYDKIGIRHQIALDDTPFLLQRKARLVYPALERWMEKGRVDKAKKAINNLVTLLRLRSEKGLFDKDPDLNSNFGFIGVEAVQIDVGRFKKSSQLFAQKEELIRITDNLKQWLDKKYPLLSQYLQEQIQ